MSKPQLFCFSYAGGNASFFDLTEKDLTEYDLVKLEYPGHGAKHKEAFCLDFDELAYDLFGSFINQYSGGRYALFGYSMGAIAAVEVLKRIIGGKEINAPDRMFLAAHEPHSRAELEGYAGDCTDEWIKERTISFGAIPEKLIGNKAFWRMYLPIYRADYSLIRNYRFEELALKTPVPATVFYSETDTPRKDMELWSRYFVGECEYFGFGGGHFFILEHHKEMAEIMNSKILQGNLS